MPSPWQCCRIVRTTWTETRKNEQSTGSVGGKSFYFYKSPKQNEENFDWRKLTRVQDTQWSSFPKVPKLSSGQGWPETNELLPMVTKVGEPVCEQVPSASRIEGPITVQGQTVLQTFSARSGNGHGPSQGEVGSGSAVGCMRWHARKVLRSKYIHLHHVQGCEGLGTTYTLRCTGSDLY